MYNIAEIIPYGKENAVSRVMLCAKTGLTDRRVRHEIELTRRKNVILNLSDGSGYYRPGTDEWNDVERYIKQEESRAKSIYRATRAARIAMRKHVFEAAQTGI